MLPLFQRQEHTGKEKQKNIVNELNKPSVKKDKIINKELQRKSYETKIQRQK